jgi:hypothetical protein
VGGGLKPESRAWSQLYHPYNLGVVPNYGCSAFPSALANLIRRRRTFTRGIRVLNALR